MQTTQNVSEIGCVCSPVLSQNQTCCDDCPGGDCCTDGCSCTDNPGCCCGQ